MLYLEYKNIYWQKNHIFFLELLQLLKDFPSTYLRRLKANGRKRDLNDIPKYKHLRIWIEDVTNAYDADILNLKSRIYWVLNGLIESPRCLNDKCKRPLNNKQFDPLSFDQPIYCSRMCLSQSSINIEKVKKTKEKHANDDIGYWKKIEEKKNRQKSTMAMTQIGLIKIRENAQLQRCSLIIQIITLIQTEKQSKQRFAMGMTQIGITQSRWLLLDESITMVNGNQMNQSLNKNSENC